VDVRDPVAFYDAPALAECKARNPAQGEVALQIAVQAHHVAVTANGSLASQASGVCIRRVLEDIIAATPLPPEVIALPEWPLHVSVP